MIKKTIEFEDFNGVTQKKDFYFNMSKGELVKMQMAAVTERTDGLQEKIQRIIDTRNGKEIVKMVEEIIDMSYGIKSGDGSRFIKNEEVIAEFRSTGAYSELTFELATDANLLAEFIKGLMPANLNAEVQKEVDSALAARQRSEAQMQGYQKKQEPAFEVVAAPQFDAAPPVLATEPTTSTPITPDEMMNMSQDQLQEAFRQGRTYTPSV